MTSEQAKQILLLYRPGTADWRDPEVAAAIEQARRDPELGHWFEQHQAFQSAVRARFRQIAVPEHLKAAVRAGAAGFSPIVFEGGLNNGTESGAAPAAVVVRPVAWWRNPVWLAAAAVFVLLLGLTGVWLRPAKRDGFVDYAQMMVSRALQGYNMECATSDMRQVRQYLEKRGAPADYQLAGGLAQLRLLGAAAFTWRSRPVAMVCFDRPDKQKVWLFVVNRADLKGAPTTVPVEARINVLMTTSWSEGDKTYIVAGPPEEGFTKRYL